MRAARKIVRLEQVAEEDHLARREDDRHVVVGVAAPEVDQFGVDVAEAHHHCVFADIVEQRRQFVFKKQRQIIQLLVLLSLWSGHKRPKHRLHALLKPLAATIRLSLWRLRL